MCEETYEQQQQFINRIQNPKEFDKFKFILNASSCLRAKDLIIPDGTNKSYHLITSYNPYLSRFDTQMYGRIENDIEGERYRTALEIKFGEKRAKIIAGVLMDHIGSEICSTCPLQKNCALETSARKILLPKHGTDEFVESGHFTPVVKGLLDINSL